MLPKVPDCSLLGFGSGGRGSGVVVLLYAFIFLVFILSVTLPAFLVFWFGLVWFGCVFNFLTFQLWGFIDKEIEDSHSICFSTCRTLD